jgi:diguanylate cyclase (GGDEF)-like protein
MNKRFSGAVKDKLTAVYTRDILDRLFAYLVEGGRFAFFIVDIDNFKLINDCNGHKRGDEILADVSRLLTEHARKGYVIRMGGDEFAIILPGFSKKSAVEFANKLFSSLKKKIFKGNPDLTVGLSVGIALYPDDCNNVEKLMEKADERLYTAKRNGRNCYCLDDKEEKKSISLLYEPVRLIGREREFISMKKRLDRVVEGKGSVLIVKGEQGMGKTFLCNKFLDYVRIRGGEVRSIQLLSNPQFSIYSSIAKIVKGLAGKSNELKTIIRKLPGKHREQLSRLAYSDELFKENATENLEYKLYKAVRVLVEKLASSFSFMVIFIDRFENIDRNSINLMKHLLAYSFNVPVLFLITVRESKNLYMEEVWKEIEESVIERPIVLEKFGKEEYRNLIKTLLRGTEISGDLASFFLQKTGGSPLFTKELLSSAISKGMIEKRDGMWIMGDKRSGDMIPGSLKNILEERLSGLNEEERKFLSLASILGIEFSIEHLKEIESKSYESMFELLRRPISFEIVEDKGEGKFSFRLLYHSLLYEKIPDSEKRMLHMKVASMLEKNKNGNMDKEIFFHYKNAGEITKSIPIAEKICDNAMKKGNAKEAKKYADFVFSNLRVKDAKDVPVISTVARCYSMNRMYDKAVGVYRKIMKVLPAKKVESILAITELYHKKGAYSLAIDELLKIKDASSFQKVKVFNAVAKNLLSLGRLKRSEVYAKKAISWAKRYKMKQDEAEGYYTIGGVFWYKGEYELAEDYLNKALDIYCKLGKSVRIAMVMNRLGIVRWSQGRLMEGEELISKAVQIFRKYSKIEEENSCYTNMGILNEALGRWKKAEGYYRRSIEMAEFLNQRSVLSRNYNNMGTLLLKMGDYEEAIKCFKETIKIRSKDGDLIEFGSYCNNLGAAYMFQGDYKASLHFLNKGRKIFEEYGAVGMKIDNLNTLFELFIYKNEKDMAKNISLILENIVDSNGTDFQKAQFYRVMSKFMRESKAIDKSRKFARMSIEHLNEGEEKYEYGKSLLELGLVLYEDGDEENAKKEFMKSRAIFKELGAEKAARRVERIIEKRQG